MVSRIYIAALLTCILTLALVEPGHKKTKHRPPPRRGQTRHLSPEKQQLIQRRKKNLEACLKFGATPYFDPKLVLGPQWRFYYTWNLRNKYNCLAMKFYETNFAIMGRFYKDMGKYLAQQPLWSSAILYMTIGAARHQMLLLAAFGPPGRVHGVPNLMRDPNFIQHKKKMSVPLMQYQLKLLQGGKYLVMMDCLEGTVTLSTQDSDAPPNETELEAVAKKLGIGDGALACPPVTTTTTTTTTTEKTDHDKTVTDYSIEPLNMTTKRNKT